MKHQKKYKVIAKINDERFVRYNVNNLKKFADFLDKEFGGFRWFNVYAYTKDGSGEQLASFTCSNRPRTAYLSF